MAGDFHFFLALFPALLLLVAVISFMPVSRLLEAITTTWGGSGAALVRG